MKSSLLWLPKTKKSLKHALRVWTRQFESKGCVILTRLRLCPKGSTSILEIFSNSNAKAKTSCDHETCACDNPEFADFGKLEGHVFQPLLDIMVRDGIELARGVNVKTRTRPNYDMTMLALRDSINGFLSRMQTKCGDHMPANGLQEFNWDSTRTKMAFYKWGSDNPSFLDEDRVRLWRKARGVGRLVCTPIDKLQQEAKPM